ncbi:hypothetical protein ACFLUU_06120 [Chloroflexota bacterium]
MNSKCRSLLLVGLALLLLSFTIGCGQSQSETYQAVRGATYAIAASDSSAVSKAQADLVCTGTNDRTTIQALFDVAGVGSTIIILPGSYSCIMITIDKEIHISATLVENGN